MSLSEEKLKKIRPLQDRVLIKRIEEENNKTAGGIFIPEGSKERAQIGIIIAVGPGKIMTSGILNPTTLKIGDSIFFGKYAGSEISENYLILREEEVLGVL